LTPTLPTANPQPAIDASPIDYSCSGEALLIADLLPAAGPRFLVEFDSDTASPWSLSRGLVDAGWASLILTGENFSALSRQNVPTHFQLLILNCADSAPALLRALPPYQPGLIVMQDPPADPDTRTNTYRQLNGLGYSYAGIAGAYSLWSTVPLPGRSHPPQPPALWPPVAATPAAVATVDPVATALASSGAGAAQTCLISGWAFVDSPAAVPPLVYIEVRDHRTGLTDYYPAHRCRRPDVSRHFGNPALEMCGFRALVTLNQRMAGAFSVGVLQLDSRFRYPSAFELVIQRPLEEYEHNPRLGLARKFLRGCGVEIGALQKSLPLPPSSQVRYVDRMPLAELLHHYPELRGLPIQAPDIIDDGEQLAKIAGGSQDFVIANHFLEHCQNPFQTLANFLRVLRVGGVLFLAVPDQRFTFDFDRRPSQYDVLIRAYRSGQRQDREELFQEWAQFVERRTGSDIAARAAELIAADYSIHYNVWTVDELLSHLLQARKEIDFPFRLLTVVCADNEAILLLEKTASI
jgi:SAM-dependent methyltransferase